MKFKTLALLAGLAVSALSLQSAPVEARGGFGGHGGYGHGGFGHGGYGGGYGRGFGRGGRGFGYGPAIGLGLGAAALGAYGAYNYARPYDYGYDCPGGRLVRDAYGQYFCE